MCLFVHQIVVACALVAVCYAGVPHYAPAVSSQNIIRHDQPVHHQAAPVHYAPIAHAAPVYHVAPAVHAPIQAVHAAPAHQDDHYVDEYVRL